MQTFSSEMDFNGDGCLSHISIYPTGDYKVSLTTTFSDRAMSFEASGVLGGDLLTISSTDRFGEEDSEDLRRVATVIAGLIKGMADARGIVKPFPRVTLSRDDQ